jgi:hypothetical protein
MRGGDECTLTLRLASCQLLASSVVSLHRAVHSDLSLLLISKLINLILLALFLDSSNRRGLLHLALALRV